MYSQASVPNCNTKKKSEVTLDWNHSDLVLCFLTRKLTLAINISTSRPLSSFSIVLFSQECYRCSGLCVGGPYLIKPRNRWGNRVTLQQIVRTNKKHTDTNPHTKRLPTIKFWAMVHFKNWFIYLISSILIHFNSIVTTIKSWKGKEIEKKLTAQTNGHHFHQWDNRNVV